jgi:hypothetical protein
MYEGRIGKPVLAVSACEVELTTVSNRKARSAMKLHSLTPKNVEPSTDPDAAAMCILRRQLPHGSISPEAVGRSAKEIPCHFVPNQTSNRIAAISSAVEIVQHGEDSVFRQLPDNSSAVSSTVEGDTVQIAGAVLGWKLLRLGARVLVTAKTPASSPVSSS